MSKHLVDINPLFRRSNVRRNRKNEIPATKAFETIITTPTTCLFTRFVSFSTFFTSSTTLGVNPTRERENVPGKKSIGKANKSVVSLCVVTL